MMERAGLGGIPVGSSPKKSTGCCKVVGSSFVGAEWSGAILGATTTSNSGSRSDDGRPVVDQAAVIAVDLGAERISDAVGNSAGRGLDDVPLSRLSAKIITESGEIEIPSSLNLLGGGETCLQVRDGDGEQAGVGEKECSSISFTGRPDLQVGHKYKVDEPAKVNISEPAPFELGAVHSEPAPFKPGLGQDLSVVAYDPASIEGGVTNAVHVTDAGEGSTSIAEDVGALIPATCLVAKGTDGVVPGAVHNPVTSLTLLNGIANPILQTISPLPTHHSTPHCSLTNSPLTPNMTSKPGLTPNNNFESSTLHDDTSEDFDLSIPPDFTPEKEDLLILRELIKERASLVPPKHQKDFVESVDNAEDGEILNFFKEKFKDTKRDNFDTNYMTFHNVRRSHHIKKKPAKLSNSISSSGLKKGFLK